MFLKCWVTRPITFLKNSLCWYTHNLSFRRGSCPCWMAFKRWMYLYLQEKENIPTTLIVWVETALYGLILPSNCWFSSFLMFWVLWIYKSMWWQTTQKWFEEVKFRYFVGGLILFFHGVFVTFEKWKLYAELYCPHICCANQLTGFYMGATLALNGLSNEYPNSLSNEPKQTLSELKAWFVSRSTILVLSYSNPRYLKKLLLF